MRCITACSIPPTYWSTGPQAATGSRSNGAVLLCGSQNRRKYQDESKKVSMVSVSRRAGFPQRGQTVLTQSVALASGPTASSVGV